jgi:uncharacterized membrane protein
MASKDIPYLKTWAIFFVIATIGGVLAGAVSGAIIGGILGASGVSLRTIPLVTAAVGFVLALPISFFTFKWAVSTYIVNGTDNTSQTGA